MAPCADRIVGEKFGDAEKCLMVEHVMEKKKKVKRRYKTNNTRKVGCDERDGDRGLASKDS